MTTFLAYPLTYKRKTCTLCDLYFLDDQRSMGIDVLCPDCRSFLSADLANKDRLAEQQRAYRVTNTVRLAEQKRARFSQ